MGQTASEIAHDIDQNRVQLGADLRELEKKVKGMVSWREQFQEHPLPLLGIAFLVGLLVAIPFGRQQKQRVA
jgi:hypothetical protein